MTGTQINNRIKRLANKYFQTYHFSTFSFGVMNHNEPKKKPEFTYTCTIFLHGSANVGGKGGSLESMFKDLIIKLNAAQEDMAVTK